MRNTRRIILIALFIAGLTACRQPEEIKEDKAYDATSVETTGSEADDSTTESDETTSDSDDIEMPEISVSSVTENSATPLYKS